MYPNTYCFCVVKMAQHYSIIRCFVKNILISRPVSANHVLLSRSRPLPAVTSASHDVGDPPHCQQPIEGGLFVSPRKPIPRRRTGIVHAVQRD